MTRAWLRDEAHRLLATELDAVAVTRLCPRCGSSAHGRPLLRVRSGVAPRISLSYAEGLVAVAWSHAGPVGIDVEHEGPPVDGLDRREWTRREAVLKAGADVPTYAVEVPTGYLGTVAGSGVCWRLAGPAAPSR